MNAFSLVAACALLTLTTTVGATPEPVEDTSGPLTAPKAKNALRAPIPQDLKHLLMAQPYVDYLLLIDEQGTVKDSIATESNHYKLLEPARHLIERTSFDPALQQGVPVPVRHELRVVFHDFQQEIWRETGQIPMGSSGTDGTGRKLFEQTSQTYAYHQSEVSELDAPLRLSEGSLLVVEGPDGEQPQGSCSIEFYIDAQGVPRLPSVITSDSELVSLSGLGSLTRMRFEPPRSKQRPTFVKVRQRFRFGDATPPTDD